MIGLKGATGNYVLGNGILARVSDGLGTASCAGETGLNPDWLPAARVFAVKFGPTYG